MSPGWVTSPFAPAFSYTMASLCLTGLLLNEEQVLAKCRKMWPFPVGSAHLSMNLSATA